MTKNINRKLIVAYSKLLGKSDEKISVTSLCEKADIARATFYIYYSDLDEFYKKLNNYIIDKFFRQAVAIVRCSDTDFPAVVKKENLLFDDYELKILSNMIQGTNYIDFVLLSDSYCIDRNADSLYTRDMWEKHKDDIDFFSRGYLPILVDELTDYEEIRFRKNMKYCRSYYKALYDYMLAEGERK